MKYVKTAGIALGVLVVAGLMLVFHKGTSGASRYMEDPSILIADASNGFGALLAYAAIGYLIYIGVKKLLRR